VNAKTCPHCHTAIPEHAPGGLCPACVLRDADEAAIDASAAPSLEEVAAAFPKLEILRLIGHGGMGYVYQARQAELDRMVALKILSPPLRHDPAFEERFAREARVLGKLQHPNIVTIYEHGESGGYFYLMMEFVDGVNLRQAMNAGRFSPEQALAIVPAICDALQSAHAQGVWHRDIKPENILLDHAGRVKIADFGIARILGDPECNFTLTRTGGLLGSAAYMAPEQYEKPHSVDHRADIYSLGVVIYEMLTGELPLGRFPLPSQRATVNARIDEIVMRTLEKERELRQQSANEVKTDMCAAAMPGGSSDQVKPSLAPTILSHAVLFALLATIFLFVLPGFAEILRNMGVPRRSLPRIFLFQSVGGLRSVSGLLLFPLLFGIDVGLCFLVRKIGGRIGLRLWNAAFIVGMITIGVISCLAMYLPMKRTISMFGEDQSGRLLGQQKVEVKSDFVQFDFSHPNANSPGASIEVPLRTTNSWEPESGLSIRMMDHSELWVRVQVEHISSNSVRSLASVSKDRLTWEKLSITLDDNHKSKDAVFTNGAKLTVKVHKYGRPATSTTQPMTGEPQSKVPETPDSGKLAEDRDAWLKNRPKEVAEKMPYDTGDFLKELGYVSDPTLLGGKPRAKVEMWGDNLSNFDRDESNDWVIQVRSKDFRGKNISGTLIYDQTEHGWTCIAKLPGTWPVGWNHESEGRLGIYTQESIEEEGGNSQRERYYRWDGKRYIEDRVETTRGG
jgi:serine/threonine protein kinase